MQVHVLVTGGAGFIGSHLAEALLAEGCQVTVIDDLSTGRFENIAHLTGHRRFCFAIDSISNEVVMDRLVSECDVIFHLAAVVGVALIVQDPVRVIETNILGTHAVLKVANHYRKKVLLASTSEIYGKSNQVPFREDDDRLLGPTTKARWSYSTSKAVDEFLGLAYHRQMGLPVVITRLFNTVGPRQTGQYGMVVPRFVQQAVRGEPLTVYGDGQQTRCFCDVRDVVRAIMGLAGCPEAVGQVFNVGSTEEVTILALAQKVLALVDDAQGSRGAGEQGSRGAGEQGSGGAGEQGSGGAGEQGSGGAGEQGGGGAGEPGSAGAGERIVFVPYAQAYEAGFEDMRRRVPDISKIKAAIGWQPQTSLEETLQRVIAYYSEAGEQGFAQ